VIVRQLYYISATKTEALEAELGGGRRWLRRAEFTGGIGVASTKIEAKLPGNPANILHRVGRLTRRMEKQGAMTPLPSAGSLTAGPYYRDEAEWAHGLFAFESDFGLGKETRIVTYLMWRRWTDSLILLVGSPNNVLGEKVVREGVWAYGTSGTWTTVLRFAEHALRTDEPNLVGAETTEAADRPPDLAWAPIDSAFTRSRERAAPTELWSSGSALALGTLCLGPLSRLPATRVDTAFRIFQRFELSLRANVPDWASEMIRKHRGTLDATEYLRNCRAVYVGSPLFAALI
jgi:hypothetical protein